MHSSVVQIFALSSVTLVFGGGTQICIRKSCSNSTTSHSFVLALAAGLGSHRNKYLA
jgi:hypothetical protein